MFGWVLLARAHAAPWCTEYGPAEVEDRAGDLSGRIGDAGLSGRIEALRVEHEGLRLFEGPWAALVPTPLSGPCPERKARIGAWPEPVPLGPRKVLRRSPADLSAWGPEGATRLLALPMDRALARALAAELDRAFPLRRTEVAWVDGIGLIVVSSDPTLALPRGELPLGAAPGVLALLGLSDPEAAPSPPEVRTDLLPGAALAAALAQVREDAGLPPAAWDPGLAEAALRHARYLDEHRVRPGTSRQDPARAGFTGETPEERGGAEEWLSTGIRGGPEAALAAWLTSPFPRARLLHPGLTRLGVAASGGAWVVELEVAGEVGPPRAWPPDRATLPSRAFTAREDPDPLPLLRHPDRRWPVGAPITVWGGAPTATALWVDGEPAEHWGVRAPLGIADDAGHLVPKAPPPPGAVVRWEATVAGARLSGTIRAPQAPLDEEVDLPAPLDGALLRANAARAERGLPPLRATLRAEATARVVGARTRAATEGLDPARLRVVLAAPPGGTEAPMAVCVRPGEPFPLDELLLDPGVAEIGADLAAVTLTTSVDPVSGARRAHLAGPRTCAILLRASLP